VEIKLPKGSAETVAALQSRLPLELFLILLRMQMLIQKKHRPSKDKKERQTARWNSIKKA